MKTITTISDFIKLVRKKKTTVADIEALAQKGFNIFESNKQGTNALHAAIMAENWKIAEYLFNQNLSISYAEPWEKMAREKNMEYFIKFDGERHWDSINFPQRINTNEMKFVEWTLKNVRVDNGQLTNAVAEALKGNKFTTTPDGNQRFVPISLEMITLLFDNIKDITDNKNQIGLSAFENKDKLLPVVYDYIVNNPKIIEAASTLDQSNLIPDSVKDIFIF